MSSKSLVFAVVSCAIVTGCWSTAEGHTISLTGGSSGGNPGGQPLYAVSNLAQGDAFNVDWGGVTGVSASAMVFIDVLTDSIANIRVMLDNSSTPISGDDPRLTVLGLGVTDFTSLASTSTGGPQLDTADDSNFPGITVDVCATAGSNCAGGGSDGIPAGSSDTFLLELNGDFLSQLTLSEFALKVQGGTGGASFELAGVPSNKVPEPTTLALLLVGLLGAYPIGARRR